ncbi:hypothetical protein M422DRAFT_89068, partial [Sphaerobolus stellatus SS14]
RLRMKQQNCKHSKDITLTLINTADPDEWDLLLLQEPYIYPDSTLTSASAKWFPLYPICPPGKTPRSTILVSANISSNTFEQARIPSDTVTSISIHVVGGTIEVYNIYNPPDSDTALHDLQNWLQRHPPTASSSNIWLGDFNKHHPLWTAPEDSDRCHRSNSDLMLQLLASYGMSLSLPPATPTYQSDAHGTWSTIDLVFTDANLGDRIISCTTSHTDRIPSADHLPIHTILNTEIVLAHREPRRNFRKVDWEKFQTTLCSVLEVEIPDAPNAKPDSPAALDEFVLKLTSSIQHTIQKHVPQSRPTEYTKRWWTPELSTLRKKYSSLSRLEFQARNTSLQQQFLEHRNRARNEYNAAVKKAKQGHWKDWLENISERDVWTAGKFAKNPLTDGGRTLIPTLHRKDQTGQLLATFDTAPTKAKALAELFFPPRPVTLPA